MLTRDFISCFLPESHLAPDVNRDADDHGGDGNSCDEGDADRRSDQSPQLPQDLLLPAPRLLPPEGAAGRTGGGKQEVVGLKGATGEPAPPAG